MELVLFGRSEPQLTPARRHGEITRPAPGTGIKLTFQDSKGNEIKTIEANEGDDLLSLAHEYDVDLEGEWGCSIPQDERDEVRIGRIGPRVSGWMFGTARGGSLLFFQAGIPARRE